MSRKPNFAKFILGVTVLALLFIGTWATTRAPRTSAKNNAVKSSAAANNPKVALPNVAAPVPLDALTSVFELDGDITDNPAGAPDDWNVLNCDGGGAVIKTGVLHDGLGTSIFTGGGSKDPDLLGSWKHKDGSVPDKDEIINAYAAKYSGIPGGDEILVFGADRYDNSGTAFMGFWFFRGDVVAAADGKFRQGPLATDPLAVHQLGDVLVLIEFTNGGTFATSKVFEWVGSGGSESGGTLQDITGTAPLGSVVSISNNSPQQIPAEGTCPASWVYQPKGGAPNGPISTNSFFEGAINLDAFPALQGACFSSFMAETRSSSVVTATLKDFVLGSFNTCVSVSLSKTATDVCEGAATTYTYKVKNLGGVTANFTLTDDNETGAYTLPFSAAQIQADDIDVGADNNCATQVGAGSPTSFSLAAGVERTFVCTIAQTAGTHNNTAQTTGSFGGSSETKIASATAKVFVNSVAAAGADQSVCKATASHQFSLDATAGSTVPPGGSVLWSGTGITFGSPTSLTTTATVSAFGTFTATLTIKSDANQTPGCPDGVDTLNLTLSQNPTADAGADQSACEDTASHQFNLVGTGTVPDGSTIQWSGTGISFGSPNSLSTTATVSAFGSFTATLSISNSASGTGCLPASDTVVLVLNQNPVITIEDVACNAAEGGTSIVLEAVLSAGGGSVSTSYEWRKVGSATIIGTNAQLTVTTPGTYTVTVKANNGTGIEVCDSVKSKNVGLCAADAAP